MLLLMIRRLFHFLIDMSESSKTYLRRIEDIHVKKEFDGISNITDDL